ncbi:MAG: PEP-CTERM sorting domain-containing protein [Planctomycetia bacterium]|nr:MAG: PEP-CTERM sorting domain-containing protein [Planctomycetia bacterium]
MCSRSHAARALFLVAAFLAAGPVPTSLAQVVIDFNGLAATHDLLTVGPYSEDAHTITSTVGGLLAEINGFQPNGLFLRGQTSIPQVVRIMNEANDPFDLLSIAIGDNTTASAVTVTVTGSSGINRLIVDGDVGLVASFGEDWRGLDWVDVRVSSSPSGAPGQFSADNITLRTVPEPGSLALLVLAAAFAVRKLRSRSRDTA